MPPLPPCRRAKAWLVWLSLGELKSLRRPLTHVGGPGMPIIKLKINPSAPQRQGARVLVPEGVREGWARVSLFADLGDDHPPHPHPRPHAPIQPPGPEWMKSQLPEKGRGSLKPTGQHVLACRAQRGQPSTSLEAHSWISFLNRREEGI